MYMYYTVYVIECTSAETTARHGPDALEGHTWNVQKRYSEFQELRQELLKVHHQVRKPPSTMDAHCM